ncbi:hypothetical protein L5515_005090 [Caenorhabditis briggsae]|uniref:F-box domain-containing protein n=1 Tax=Caenorhabditis briggsae TaxID=6238 RepID=A0AAE9ERQ3_CAEBR|nr:hypothetical protein L5515_005090 [Caenorhabditis briggsae]
MTTQRFPLHRLPDDLRSEVLKTMDLHEIVAYSFVSKKAYSMVKSLRIPIGDVETTLKASPEIKISIGLMSLNYELKIHENDRRRMELNKVPVNVKVELKRSSILDPETSTMSNQGKNMGEWIQHLCSIFQHVMRLHIEFLIGDLWRLDIETLLNTFPTPRSYSIVCDENESNKYNIRYARNVFKAFPDVQFILLFDVPFDGRLSFQHFGKLEDLLTLNVERIHQYDYQWSLRDLNRFFKLWMKGSNPKLKKYELFAHEMGISWADQWNVLVKGLQAEEVVEAGHTDENRVKKKFRIRKHRVGAEIEVEWTATTMEVKFNTLN